MSSRILLTLEYDGTPYCGWQRQLNGPSVQQCLEEALQKLLKKPITVTGASRTDAGVHALGQCAHFDMQSTIPPEKLPFALNTLLPRDIRVLLGQAVGPHFHARFDARGKEYSYLLLNRRHPSALMRDRCWHVPLPLDVDAMRAAAQQLLGRQDFAAFQASGGTAKTTVRTIHHVKLLEDGEYIRLVLHGDAFLYNMVRIIAGTLVLVGQGKLPADCIRTAIRTGDRLALGPTAPPQGLTLCRVDYDAL